MDRYIGKSIGRLTVHAHHICDYGSYPTLRFEEKNGITLCKKCHESFHKDFPSKSNNEHQLKLFLKRP